MRIGERVRGLRAQRELTQAGLAHLVGVSKETIHRIERGQSPRLETLYGLARAFDLPVAELLEGRAEEPLPPSDPPTAEGGQ